MREDIQVIVVDDCSEGAENFLEKYPELSRPYLEFYPTKEGRGAGYARNVGLDQAQGDWILFPDSDDFFFTDRLNKLLDTISLVSADVIIYGVKILTFDNKYTQGYNNDFYTYSQVENFDNLLLHCEPWRKVIKRSFIEKHHLRFEEVPFSNDVRFHVQLMSYASNESIVQFHSNVYCWVLRDNSLFHTINISSQLCRFNVSLRTSRFAIKQGWGYCYHPYVYLWRIKHLSKSIFYFCFVKECFYLGLHKAIVDYAYTCNKDNKKPNLIFRGLYILTSKHR